MWKNVHALNGAGIWTHDFQILSLILDQGSDSKSLTRFLEMAIPGLF